MNVLMAANSAMERAIITGDPAMLENFYTADYRLIDDEGKVQDKPARIQFLTESIDILDARSANAKANALSKNVALISGRWSGRYQINGQVQEFAQSYTRIWVTEDSQWRLRHEHFSAIEDEQ